MRTLAILILSLGVCGGASAQSLIEAYTRARFQVVAEQILAEQGMRTPALAPEHLPTPVDTLQTWLAEHNPALRPEVPVVEEPFSVGKWRLVKRLERPWFRKKHRDTRWAYLGSNSLAPADTIRTAQLRARMQAYFGSPTKTLTEVDISDGFEQEEYIQFEYWFAVNDTIPVKVMDVNGPFERGVVVATADVYRDRLPDIRRAFLDPVAQSVVLASYVDYYYVPDIGAWYRTGYENGEFFVSRIGRPSLVQGRPVPPRVGDEGDRGQIQ